MIQFLLVLLFIFSADDIWTIFEWTPEIGDRGRYNVIFNVTDGEFTDQETISIRVKKREGSGSPIFTRDKTPIQIISYGGLG